MMPGTAYRSIAQVPKAVVPKAEQPESRRRLQPVSEALPQSPIEYRIRLVAVADDKRQVEEGKLWYACGQITGRKVSHGQGTALDHREQGGSAVTCSGDVAVERKVHALPHMRRDCLSKYRGGSVMDRLWGLIAAKRIETNVIRLSLGYPEG
jgi:hypothetical protein